MNELPVDPALAAEDFCYLTTIGRVTGRPRTIEIWFALEGDTVYMLSGGRDASNWVKNLKRHPEVKVRIRDAVSVGRARLVEGTDEGALARRLLLEKYQARYSGDLGDWGRTALPVAVDLSGQAG
jgi:deazaflavin-dependent oxidoreductase (nitroreductase family)